MAKEYLIKSSLKINFFFFFVCIIIHIYNYTFDNALNMLATQLQAPYLQQTQCFVCLVSIVWYNWSCNYKCARPLFNLILNTTANSTQLFNYTSKGVSQTAQYVSSRCPILTLKIFLVCLHVPILFDITLNNLMLQNCELNTSKGQRDLYCLATTSVHTEKSKISQQITRALKTLSSESRFPSMYNQTHSSSGSVRQNQSLCVCKRKKAAILKIVGPATDGKCENREIGNKAIREKWCNIEGRRADGSEGHEKLKG